MKRGQATVELALGILIFITVLVFGIHFAELGYLSMKVTESAGSALFDTTAERMHRVWDPKINGANWTLWRQAVQAAGPKATSRYADFDGLSSRNGGGRVTQVFTEAKDLTVRCEERTGAAYPYQHRIVPGHPLGDSSFACSSEATLGAVNVPKSFADDSKGFFGAPHFTRTSYKICSAGRAVNATQCRGEFGTLLDDWGLAGPEERTECRIVGGCQNTGYWELARGTYYSTLSNIYFGATEDLLNHVTGNRVPLPMREGLFRMSFRGSESQYLELEPGSHGNTVWETTAYQWPIDYSTPRTQCWLGNPC